MQYICYKQFNNILILDIFGNFNRMKHKIDDTYKLYNFFKSIFIWFVK